MRVTRVLVKNQYSAQNLTVFDFWPFHTSLINDELLPKRDVLNKQIVSWSKYCIQSPIQQFEHTDHEKIP